MSQVFHPIEKKIIKELKSQSNLTQEELESKTGLSADQIRRGIEWLKLKDLAIVHETHQTIFELGKNGLDAHKNKLPERRLYDLVRSNPKPFDELKKQFSSSDFNAAIANARKNNWIQIEKSDSSNIISSKGDATKTLEEQFIEKIADGSQPSDAVEKYQKAIDSLKKRPDFILENQITSKTIALSENAQKIDTNTIDSDAIDVEASTPSVFPARIHPLKETIDEIREIFATLGFSEIIGDLTQSSFWNFDALFTPQDHPAREMQDTFYLDKIKSKKFATAGQIKQVSQSHKQNWHYLWDVNEAQKMVLRTHTTCVTIKHLAENKPDEARIFSLGRVFRNEKVSYKHLVEFNQVEGVVVGKNATLRNLMGIQREFYKKIGITKIKFWPTFFPYTEPSLQTMVYNDRLGKWVELFGMGIFRPEVTKPLGITKPVLAWGGGIERIAMLKYGLDDVREFYNNDLKWLRSATKCQ